MDSTENAKFAVGYFFVSGLEAISGHFKEIKEIKLLIGNTTNRETLEQLIEAYKRLESVIDASEAIRYPKRIEIKRMTEDTALNLREAIEVMDQTESNHEVLNLLVELIANGCLKVKVYTKGKLHAKAYIFDYKQDGRYEKVFYMDLATKIYAWLNKE